MEGDRGMGDEGVEEERWEGGDGEGRVREKRDGVGSVCCDVLVGDVGCSVMQCVCDSMQWVMVGG